MESAVLVSAAAQPRVSVSSHRCGRFSTGIEQRPDAADALRLGSFADGYDLMAQRDPVVCNDFHLQDPERIIVVSGPNQGCKSTFLRSVGLAQLMMQAGMFVPAESLRADVRHGIFSHFRREEDAFGADPACAPAPV